MSDYQVKAPIVFMVFNRPDTTKVVFEKIRAVKPKKLLVIADGPRPERPSDLANCKLTREIALKVDWECDVQTNFSETNLGCRQRIASGLTWAFNQVDRAIILEDDCVPGESFFRFCDELLEKYKDETRVMHITGSNFMGSPAGDASYFFSRFPHVWGWASWRRAWKEYDVDISEYPTNGPSLLGSRFKEKRFSRFWVRKFEQIRAGFNTWDYQWAYACFKKDGLCVIPRVNLISNIGFNSDATHTLIPTENADLETQKLKMPLVHPKDIAADINLDNRYMNNTTSLLLRLKNRLRLQFR